MLNLIFVKKKIFSFCFAFLFELLYSYLDFKDSVIIALFIMHYILYNSNNMDNKIKINNALNNNVYVVGDRIRKEYINNQFKSYFGNQEDEGLIASGIEFNLGSGYIDMEIIEHKPWDNSKMKLEDNIKFIKWLKKFHESANINTLEFPGFREAYIFLNPAVGKFRKKNNWWRNEEGIVKDALNILASPPHVFLHNDLVEGNILLTEDGYKLIDWEFGGKGNPLFDVASFISERNISFEDGRKIALAYDKDINFDDLWIVVSFLEAFWARWAWYKFQETQNIVYKTIYETKYKKFVNLTK